MRMFVVRHADAGDNIPDDPKADDARVLTAEGIEAVKTLAAWMIAEDDVPNCILAGPCVRTQQTGRILRDAFVAAKYSVPKVIVEDGLRDGVGHALAPVVKKVAADKNYSRVMIVSHHDAINGGLRALNTMEPHEIDPLAKGELRVLKVNRDDGTWKEKLILRPSDLGLSDLY